MSPTMYLFRPDKPLLCDKLSFNGSKPVQWSCYLGGKYQCTTRWTVPITGASLYPPRTHSSPALHCLTGRISLTTLPIPPLLFTRLDSRRWREKAWWWGRECFNPEEDPDGPFAQNPSPSLVVAGKLTQPSQIHLHIRR